MGLFDRLFGKDPEKELNRAEALLNEGDAEKALKVAQKVAAGNPALARAEKLVAQIRGHLVSEFTALAQKAEESGNSGNAAEWLEIALKYVEDSARRAELEQKIKALHLDAEEEDEPEFEPEVQPARTEEPQEEVHHGMDPEIHYMTLVGMLEPGYAERYEGRPEAFINAFLDLNESRVEEAIEALDALLAGAPGDPVYLLERARCALILDDAEKACDCLEKAWPALGDEDLDLAGSLSVPGLWADAMLRLEKPRSVIERLENLADPTLGREFLCLHYGRALEMDKRLEDAVEHFRLATIKFERKPWFVLHLADALEALGRWQQAIQRLEKFVAPSCASGHCGVPKHLPSIRRLAGLYLTHRVQPQRAKELLNHVAASLDGNLTREDFMLLAAYHNITGNAEAAAEAIARAEEMVEQTPGMEDAGIPKMEAGEKAVI